MFHKNKNICHHDIKREILKSQPPIRKSNRISIEDIDAALTKEDQECRGSVCEEIWREILKKGDGSNE